MCECVCVCAAKLGGKKKTLAASSFFRFFFSAHLKSLSATHCRVQVALCTLEVAPASSSHIALWIRVPRARRRPKIHPPDSAAVPEHFSHVWWNTLGMPWGPEAEAVTQERGGAVTSEQLHRRLSPPALSLVSNLCHRRLSSKSNFMSGSVCETRFLRHFVCSAYFCIRANEHELSRTECVYTMKNAKNKKKPNLISVSVISIIIGTLAQRVRVLLQTRRE